MCCVTPELWGEPRSGESQRTTGYTAQRRKEKEMAIGPNVVDDCEGMTEEDYWRGMDEAMQDEEGDEPFCNCTTGHSIEETDWNQCDSCGKPIYDEEPAVSPAPTFADGMTAEDDMRFLDLTNDLTHNVRSQATDAALSRQVACTDGLCGNGLERGGA